LTYRAVFGGEVVKLGSKIGKGEGALRLLSEVDMCNIRRGTWKNVRVTEGHIEK